MRTITGNIQAKNCKNSIEKRNKVKRVVFSLHLCTDGALPLLHLLELLTVKNIYKLQLLKFTHQWHSKKLPNIHTYNTRYASKSNFYKSRFRTNIGNLTTSAMATEMWKQLPTHIKNVSTDNFPKKLKEYLLAEQLVY